MIESQSSLSREEIVEQLQQLLPADQVETAQEVLDEARVDRFKKYQSVHGLYTAPRPAAVVGARSTEEVAQVLGFAQEHRINIVPRTGRTGTEGGLETSVEDSVVLDCSAMDQILTIDAENMQATVQAGVPLQRLEDSLRAQGLTTGHSPQSKPLAQYGGLVATRSIGQFSTLYGAIEDMVTGLEIAFPGGEVSRIKSVPRRAAGPDIRHIAIGNEGALGVITEVTIQVFRFEPENYAFHGFLVDDIATGAAILREVIVNGFRPSVTRLYSPEDANQHFAHFSENRCVVVFVAEGPASLAAATSAEIERVAAQHEHRRVDPELIREWFENLNWGTEKIEAEKRAMLETAHLGFTTEVSVNWSEVVSLYDSIMARIREEFPRAEDLTMLGAHSSHSYQTGTNLYFVYDYTISCEPEQELGFYHTPINAIIVEETLRHGGSMVHHHGIGKYRTPWTEQEHGSSYPMLQKLKESFDPQGIMNRGTIFPVAGAIPPEAEQPRLQKPQPEKPSSSSRSAAD